ncbi:MAG: XdhC family protein [Gemmatimonadales bacterium]
MKQWQETTAILDHLAALARAGKRAVLATVVHIEGSAYRRAGAKLLIEESGATMGGVSGGCLEADVRGIALAALADGRPRLKHYDTGSDENMIWGLGLGCNGAVDVFVQPVTSEAIRETLEAERQLLAGDERFASGTVVVGDSGLWGRSLLMSASGTATGSTTNPKLDRQVQRFCAHQIKTGESLLQDVADVKVFVEVCIPPPRLMIFGAGDDAMPLCASAAAVGFRVTVVDHRPAFLSRDRFPDALALNESRPDNARIEVTGDTFAITMTHSLKHDTDWVKYLLSTDVSYIGMLGPRQRTQEILESVGGLGDSRVFGPVGLDIGADGPEQVAASVVAELLAVHSKRDPRHLREREGAINVR